MSVIIDSKGTLFRSLSFKKEADFESIVVELSDQIFGSSTIYIDQKKKMKGNDILTIPDGYLIDMAEPETPKLYIIENEIVSHDPFKHIGIQILKFVTSFDGAKMALRKFLMDVISKDKDKLARLEVGQKQSTSDNIDHYLDRTVYEDFRGLVIIDEAKNELHNVLGKINADISVIEVKTFESDRGDRLFQFDTLYDEFDEDIEISTPAKKGKRPPSSPKERAKRRTRRIESDTVVVPAREEGFERVFLEQDQWYEIRIGAAMKERIKYIAAYQVAPISAVTHIAEVKEIKPYKDTGKYVLYFKEPAKAIKKPIKLKDPKNSPQGPVYVRREVLLKAKNIEEALK